MIKAIQLKHFRCHETLSLKFNQNFIYIDGNNGSGKTSILESIYFISTTKSHRTTDELEMIQKDQPFMQTMIKTADDTFEIVLSNQGKKTFINKVAKRKISDFIGKLKVVMFAPEDLNLVKGSPSDRRQFIDLEWMKLNPNYLRYLNEYKKILKQRNALLKTIKVGDDYTFLNIMGEQLIEVGLKISSERETFLEMLNEYLKINYKLFSNHEVSLVYKMNVTKEQYIKHMQKNQKQDIYYQMTLVGPHKDDFTLYFNGFEAKNFASQGEQRLLVIALKLALLNTIETLTKEKVVLLLDDVLSELDQDKQKLFLKYLPKEHQIIMNSAFPIMDQNIQMIHLSKE